MTDRDAMYLANELDAAADWKSKKPFQDAELFRRAAAKIRALEQENTRLKARYEPRANTQD